MSSDHKIEHRDGWALRRISPSQKETEWTRRRSTAHLQCGLLGRQDQLSGGSNVEFLQHLQADTAAAIQPETGDQLDGNPAFLPAVASKA
jgi:hypothetical protein